MAIAECQLQNVTADKVRCTRATAGERRGRPGPVAVLLHHVEDAVPPGPQTPQIRRPEGTTPVAATHRQVFPGSYRLARFEVDEPAGQVRINVTFRDGQVQLAVTAVPADAFISEVFGTLDDAVGFFRRGALGFSPSARAGCLDGVRLHSARWAAQPMRAEIRSSLFDDTALFPHGTCSLDSTLVMRDLPARWDIDHPLTPAPAPAEGKAGR